MKMDINNILVIGIILVVILLVCLKCLDIQNKLQENFDDMMMPNHQKKK